MSYRFAHACDLADLEEAKPRRVVLEGVPVAVVLAEDGKVYAIADRCSHADVPLSEGDVEDTFIECFLHGSAFDLRTGEPTSLPANKPVPVYPVRDHGGHILVGLPAPTPAQES